MNLDFPLILASESPRRKQILEEAGFNFTIRKTNVSEDFSNDMDLRSVARELAIRKATTMREQINEREVVIAADTIVLHEGSILGKPQNEGEAINMLSSMAGKSHEVITGVCILSKGNQVEFDDTTEVVFAQLEKSEIEHYVRQYKPFDKAGAYGIQEWIGMVGIIEIKGSYFNVVGLPIQKVYANLLTFEP